MGYCAGSVGILPTFREGTLYVNVSNGWTINTVQHSRTSKTSAASERLLKVACVSVAYVNMINVIPVLQSFRNLICEGGGRILLRNLWSIYRCLRSTKPPKTNWKHLMYFRQSTTHCFCLGRVYGGAWRLLYWSYPGYCDFKFLINFLL